jgi:preprotein translocase subunit SecG
MDHHHTQPASDGRATEHPHEARHNPRAGHQGHNAHDMGGINSMALSATLHCLTGCAIGEIAGLMIGTAIGLSTGWTITLAVSLAFLFGYALSTLPLVKTGLGVGAALSVVFAADTLSIATMEVVDNLVMAIIPGAMEAGLVNWVFWVSMMIALTAAFFAAYPVNRYLMQRGKGHALTHQYHGANREVTGARRYIPSFTTSTLVAAIVAFMVGGLAVSVADELGNEGTEQTGHALSAQR